jgi:osmotically inducible protein OsmC
VRGGADGVDEAAFAKLADEAKAGCPVSKALTGTTITLSVNP